MRLLGWGVVVAGAPAPPAYEWPPSPRAQQALPCKRGSVENSLRSDVAVGRDSLGISTTIIDTMFRLASRLRQVLYNETRLKFEC